MKLTRLFVMAMLLPILSMAQGIRFEEKLSLQEVYKKAQKENKYIFIDLYASWCVPCKMMDKNVYSTDTVGNYFNAHFISFKVQMDQTKSDNEYIKSHYPDAELIKKQFEVMAYPTFLFLSASGVLVHKAVGYQPPIDFLQIARQATDPKINYTGQLKRFREGQLKRFRQGQLKPEEMRLLASEALKLDDKKSAFEIAGKYKQEYLDSVNEDELLTADNLNFIVQFSDLLNVTDPLFKAIYKWPRETDSISGIKGISKSLTDFIITRDEVFKYTGERVNTKLGVDNFPSQEPDWGKIIAVIQNKYDAASALRVVTSAKVRWYEYKKDWKRFVNVALEQAEQQKIDTSTFEGKSYLNGIAYSIIFKYSEDPKILDKGLKWMESILPSYPDRYTWLDTYANLLYKRGRVKEAITYQKKAVDLAKGKDESDFKELSENLNKMINAKPTWDAN